MPETTCPKHDDYKPILVAIAIGDTMVYDPVEVDEVRRHAADCAFCRRELEAYKATVAALTPPPIPNEDERVAEIAENVRRNVLAKLDAWERRRRGLRWAGALAAAAALALAVVALWPGRAEGLPRQGRQVEAPPPSSPEPKQATPRPQPPAKTSADKPITPEHEQMLAKVARLREQGHRLVRRRKYNEAEKPLRQGLQLVQRILDTRPGAEAKEKALYQEYRCHELLGRPIPREDSFKAYLALVRRRGGDDAVARVLVKDAHRLIRQRDMAVAGRRLNRALVLCPKGRTAVAAHVLLGLAAERQRLYDLAHSQYQTALAMKPPPELAVKIARTMLSISAAQDRTDAALADARKLCALADEHLPPEDRLQPQWLLARLLAEKGKTVQAARLFRSIAAAGDSPMAQVARLELQRLADGALDIEEGIP